MGYMLWWRDFFYSLILRLTTCMYRKHFFKKKNIYINWVPGLVRLHIQSKFKTSDPIEVEIYIFFQNTYSITCTWRNVLKRVKLHIQFKYEKYGLKYWKCHSYFVENSYNIGEKFIPHFMDLRWFFFNLKRKKRKVDYFLFH